MCACRQERMQQDDATPVVSVHGTPFVCNRSTAAFSKDEVHITPPVEPGSAAGKRLSAIAHSPMSSINSFALHHVDAEQAEAPQRISLNMQTNVLAMDSGTASSDGANAEDTCISVQDDSVGSTQPHTVCPSLNLLELLPGANGDSCGQKRDGSPASSGGSAIPALHDDESVASATEPAAPIRATSPVRTRAPAAQQQRGPPRRPSREASGSALPFGRARRQ
jgi:hypothetical protein